MSKILISACLLGKKTRFDGKDNLHTHTRLWKWVEAKNIIPICPEVAGGLSIPRAPAEIEHGKTAQDVLNGKARIMTADGKDVRKEYIAGAHKALDLIIKHDVSIAILKARSPSCSSKQVYDGTYSQSLVDGIGITATLLSLHGVSIFDETQIDLALDLAKKLIYNKSR